MAKTDDQYNFGEEESASRNTIKTYKKGDYFAGFLTNVEDYPSATPDQNNNYGAKIFTFMAVAVPGKELVDHSKSKIEGDSPEPNPIEAGEEYSFYCNYKQPNKIDRNGVILNKMKLGAIAQFVNSGFKKSQKNPAYSFKDLGITISRRDDGSQIIHRDYVSEADAQDAEIASATEDFGDA